MIVSQAVTICHRIFSLILYNNDACRLATVSTSVSRPGCPGGAPMCLQMTCVTRITSACMPSVLLLTQWRMRPLRLRVSFDLAYNSCTLAGPRWMLL